MNTIQFNLASLERGTDLAKGLNILSKSCASFSSGVTQAVTDHAEPFDWFPSSPNIKKICIIVYTTDMDPAYLTDIRNGMILRHSVGHCYASWDSTKGICGIWDVCLHRDYLTTKGMGSRLLENILFSLVRYLPTRKDITTGVINPISDEVATIIWLCVDLNNVNFSNVIGLYTKYGFDDPALITVDPFGNDWSHAFPNKLVSLSRKNRYMLTSEIDKDYTINNIIYLLQKSIKLFGITQQPAMVPFIDTNRIEPDPTESCSATYKFDADNIILMQTFPQTSLTMNLDGTISQKEISGVYIIEGNFKVDDNGSKKIIWDIALDIDSLNYGTEGSTAIITESVYNFHTHPEQVYTKLHMLPYEQFVNDQIIYKIIVVGHPSPPDYMSILYYSSTTTLKWHSVLSTTGIYIININKYWYNSETKLATKMTQIISDTEKELLKREVNTVYGQILPGDVNYEHAQAIIKTFDKIEHAQAIMETFDKIDADSQYILPESAPKATTWGDLVEFIMQLYWGMDWQFPTTEKYTSDAEMEKARIHLSCKEYSRRVSSLRPFGPNIPPIFDVQYMSWEEAYHGHEFTVDFSSYDNNCFVTKYATTKYKELFGHP